MTRAEAEAAIARGRWLAAVKLAELMFGNWRLSKREELGQTEGWELHWDAGGMGCPQCVASRAGEHFEGIKP